MSIGFFKNICEMFEDSFWGFFIFSVITRLTRPGQPAVYPPPGRIQAGRILQKVYSRDIAYGSKKDY